MKFRLIAGCLLLMCSVYGQDIKKKLYGSYEGTISGYRLDVGQTVVVVAPTTISLLLTDNRVVVQKLGNTEQKGTWQVENTEKGYYLITLRLEGQLTEERIYLYKKTKTIVREGIFPQPDVTLEHLKK